MKLPSSMQTACYCSLLFFLYVPTSAVITLSTTQTDPVRIQVAWDDVPERATVAGLPTDCKPFQAHTTISFDDMTITNNKPIRLTVAKNRQLFLALAGYCDGKPISCQKQIVLPVADGAELFVEDLGQGDLAVKSIPAITLINKTQNFIRIMYHVKKAIAPWQHQLQMNEVRLAPADSPSQQDAAAHESDNKTPTTLSLAPVFMHWTQYEPPLLCAEYANEQKKNPFALPPELLKTPPQPTAKSLKVRRIVIPIDCLYPFYHQQTVIEFNPKKAYLYCAGQIIAKFKTAKS